MAKRKIVIENTEIAIVENNERDYISLTDMVKASGGAEELITNWMRNRNTLEFMRLWEELNNPHFKPHGFEGFKDEFGLNSFWMSPKKWIDATGAVGIYSKSGRYGGTYAHRDIAFEFGTWISPRLKLYLVTEYQRLKEEESTRLLGEQQWSLRRELSKLNYSIHTEAIKDFLMPQILRGKKIESSVYASEADLLNMAVFGMTARQWQQINPHLKGNMRDHATLEQLLILSNIENLNAELIRQKMPQEERLFQLNEVAVRQMGILLNDAERRILSLK
ncbi:MAG: KilA-N domain-containing protein [Saprospiraceae bacterium]|nr:KilA-N domain-containing protein [Saprospiraceae bacterium]